MHGPLNRRSNLVYATLAALWIAVVVWQWREHVSVLAFNRTSMVGLGRAITSTLGTVLRSQRRFGQFTIKERLEPALRDLIRPGYLDSIALLSTNGEQIVAAGAPIDVSREVIQGPGVYWGPQSLTLLNLVDLGSSENQENASGRTTIVLSEDMIHNPFASNRMGFRHRGDWRDRREPRPEDATNHLDHPADSPPEGPDHERGGPPPPPPEFRGRPPFGRPPWMSETEYQGLIQKRGVHSFVIGMSTNVMHASNAHDLWLRVVIVLLATAAAGVSAFAWRNVARSSELQIRLVRASEMNAHLKEMNLAAAGLAHETRNPLNLIRGLAQMISKEGTAQPEIRDRSKAIMDEADRVTAQLNEFINYSRPRDVRRGSVSFNKVAGEVARALGPDAEDKETQIRLAPSDVQIDADDQLFRQVMFNLMLNAVQAVGTGGAIEVAIRPVEGTDEAVIEVRDNGPGVPPEHRTEIFKPYVTMHQNGTGLGLAIVQQIVAAHGWEIECTANDPRGAVFRIRRVKLAVAKK